MLGFILRSFLFLVTISLLEANENDLLLKEAIEDKHVEIGIDFSKVNRKDYDSGWVLQWTELTKGKPLGSYEVSNDSVVQPKINCSKFHFGKKNPRECITILSLGGIETEIVVNRFPVLPHHFLLVPEVVDTEGNPIHHQEFEETAMRVVEGFFSQFDARNLKLSFNSPCGGSTVNHLHIQGFYYTDPRGKASRMAVENSFQQATLLGYFDHCKVFINDQWPVKHWILEGKSIQDVLKETLSIVNELKSQNTAHNLLFTSFDESIRVFIFPRKRSRFLGFMELSGEIALRTDYGVNEDDVFTMLQDASLESEYLIQMYEKQILFRSSFEIKNSFDLQEG